MKPHSRKLFLLLGFSAGVVLCATAFPGGAFPEKANAPFVIFPPKLSIHCLREKEEISFIVRWDYLFSFSSRKVSGFRIYRRVEKGDYELLANVSKSPTEGSATVHKESPENYVYSYRDGCVRPGLAYSYKVVAFDTDGNEAFSEVRIRTDPAADEVAGPGNVLVVVNEASSLSVEIGEYYRKGRGIPQENLFRLPYPGGTETISAEDFEKKIKEPVRQYLTSHGLKEKVLCIVMTYELPYKIAGSAAEVESVDAYLTDLFDEHKDDPNFEIGPRGGRYRNPYYLAGSHFSRANGNRGYLVTRLDGPLARPGDARYNKETAHPDDPLQYLKNMADYALWAEQNPEELSGKGYFDRRFDAPWTITYGKGDMYINGAYDCCVSLGFQSVLDTHSQLFGTSPADSGGENPLLCDNALWYAGWYSHFYSDVFQWRKGAVGFHLESWTALNIRKGAEYKGRSEWLWVPGMIRAGITATMGPVHEPGMGGVPRIDWFFRYFLHGFSFSESVYMANYVAAGQMVMIGDPLYTPFRKKELGRTPPKITLASPTAGQTVRGAKVVVEGTLGDKNISMLDNARPVRDGRFSYTQVIGTSETNEAQLEVVVSATDSSGNATSPAVTVQWANRPPSLDPVQPLETSEGKTLSFSLKGADPDNDDLTYEFAIGSARPRGATLNYRTGRFTWKPDFDQAGTYDFAFRVSDGFASDLKHGTVTVLQAGSHAPKFQSLPEKVRGQAGRPVRFVLNADDLDGDTLEFSTESSLPEGARIRQSPPSRGVLRWTPTPQQVGLHRIVFTVSDGKGGKDKGTVEFEIVSRQAEQSC